MASIVVLTRNYAEGATLSGGSYVATLPLSNLKDIDIGKVARTTNALNASTQFKADLGNIPAIGGVALGPTNISPGKTYRFRGYSDAAYSVLVADSGVKTVTGTAIDWSSTGNWLAWEDPGFWLGIPNILDQDDLPIYLAHVLASDASVRYWHIEVFDETNGNGYLQYGYLMIAKALRPAVNYGYGAELVPVPVFDRNESLGLKRTDWDRGRRRTWRLSFESLANSELFQLFSLGWQHGATKPVFVIPDPDDTTYFQKTSFLATLKSPPPIVQAYFDGGTSVIDLEEVR